MLDFFENSFYITDQYAGLRALEWEDPNTDEMIMATSCAYLTDGYMQSLVSSKAGKEDDEEDEDEMSLADTLAVEQAKDDDAPLKYSDDIEAKAYIADDSNLKQVEAKILDFNWIFIGDNNARLTKILSETDNDEIFATA